jgi:hypothetical protein
MKLADMKLLEEKQGLYIHNLVSILAESGKDTSSSICKSFMKQQSDYRAVISRSETLGSLSFGECADFYQSEQLVFSGARSANYSDYRAAVPLDIGTLMPMVRKIVLEKILGT